MKIIKSAAIFFGSFLIYHIFFSQFFPVDENNVLQAPDWYVWLGLLIAGIVTLLFSQNNKITKRRKTHSASSRENHSFKSKNGAFVVPYTKKRQLELAQSLITNIEVCVSLANETDHVSLFVEWYDEALEDISKLMQLKKVSFKGSPYLDHHRLVEEFQWHLCDAIARAKESTISDIKNKYKNSREFQVRAADVFEYDINSVRSRFSVGTETFAAAAIEEVRRAAKLTDHRAIGDCFEDRVDMFGQYGGPDAELLSIDLMEGHDFEHWCAKLLTDIGYTNVQVTRGSGDQGVDVLAQKDGIKYAIQCKCYSSDLGNTPIQEVNAGKTIYHCHIGVVMTNRFFTAGAKQAADATGILLWDRNWIKNAITKLNDKRDTP